MNYVGKLLTDCISGKESSLVFGTPDAHNKDVQLTKDTTFNDNVTASNRRYAQKFGNKVQAWINELTEGNAHRLSKMKVDGVSGQCMR